MVQLLSPDWVAQLAGAGAKLPARPGATATLQHVVSGTPDGEVAYTVVLVDGRLASAALGRDDAAADCTFLVGYEDLVAIAKGELTLEAGFMQGRVKMTGSTGSFLAAQPVLQSDEYAALLEQLAAGTAF